MAKIKTDYEAFERLLDKAHSAANAAQAGMRENMNACDCGFAWVTVHPGNHPFAAYCRQQAKRWVDLKDPAMRRRYGAKGYPTGWSFWCPGEFNGQSMPIHEAGARAFRDVVALDPSMGGARVEVGSRYD